MQASLLWNVLIHRTDELYVSHEDLHSTWEAALHALIGTSAITLQPANLKDPVRVHEKAMDSYIELLDNFNNETVIPEACITDIIRCRAIADSPVHASRVLKQLEEGHPRCP